MAAGYAILNFMAHRLTYRAKGFTLIELIAVIAIVAVMSGLSLASFSTLSGDRITANARKIVSDLCWVRQLAVTTHQNYVVDFTAANYAIYRGSVSPSNQVKAQTLHAGITLSAAPSQLTFSFPQGTTQNGNIGLSFQGKTKTVVTFANTGYAKIQ